MRCTQPVLARVQHVTAAFADRLVSSAPSRLARVVQTGLHSMCLCASTSTARKPEPLLCPFCPSAPWRFPRPVLSSRLRPCFLRSSASQFPSFLPSFLLPVRSWTRHARRRGDVVPPPCAARRCLAGCNAATRVQARGVSRCACAWGVVGVVVARSDVHAASHWRGRGGRLVGCWWF